MQLDNTRIAIRERDLLETLDLALHVTRQFAGPWLICSLLGIVPLALVNYALVGWMIPWGWDEEGLPWRYLWSMSILVYLEAPLASAFVVAYLGPAVFLETKTIRQVVSDVFHYALQISLCQFLLRGVLAAWLLYFLVERYQFSGPVEGFLLPCLALYATGMRAFRPYINEIILLERNPLRSNNPNVITVNKRSSHIHGPYSGDLFIRWLGLALIALLLIFMVLATAIVVQGVLIGRWPFVFDTTRGPAPWDWIVWQLNWFEAQVAFPLCIWLIVAFMSVVRFLSYLDLRIRHEGWEVELLMRAEAMRLAARME
ncbi:MAG TPA: hypothetical protein VFV87_06465 [Pirellulaceae bacterium]|nr:hypothetical protein [Pirellulaceae bacterium]